MLQEKIDKRKLLGRAAVQKAKGEKIPLLDGTERQAREICSVRSRHVYRENFKIVNSTYRTEHFNLRQDSSGSGGKGSFYFQKIFCLIAIFYYTSFWRWENRQQT